MSLDGIMAGNQIQYNVQGRLDHNGSVRAIKARGLGYFYGPLAREVGGAFVIQDRESDRPVANAAFYGRR